MTNFLGKLAEKNLTIIKFNHYIDIDKVARNSIMKTRLCNVYPLTPHISIVKLGFTGVYIILMALYLLHTYRLLCTIATFQKAGTCLEAQQGMAKQPIKGCVSNHSRTCGESVSKKSE